MRKYDKLNDVVGWNLEVTDVVDERKEQGRIDLLIRQSKVKLHLHQCATFT